MKAKFLFLLLLSLSLFTFFLQKKVSLLNSGKKQFRYLAERGIVKILGKDNLVNLLDEINEYSAMRWRVQEEPNSTRHIINKRIIVNNFPLAYTDKLVYEKGEFIQLEIIDKGLSDIEIRSFNPFTLGNRILEERKNLVNNNFESVIYDNFYGIESRGPKIKINTDNLPSGWLSIHIKTDKEKTRNIPIFIEPISSKSIVFVESTDTLSAYNPSIPIIYGIPSHYKRLGRTHASITSMADSYAFPKNTPVNYEILNNDQLMKLDICSAHLINADNIIKKSLASKNIYPTSVSDQYLDDYSNLKDKKLIIFGAHNEYWTKEKAENIIRFINEEKGKILFLGGNNAWREVIRNDNVKIIAGYGLLKKPIFNELIKNVLGSYYDPLGYDTSAAFKVKNKNVWKENFGINIENNLIFANGSDLIQCKNKINGGSGHETDKILTSSSDFVELAKGLNDNNGGASIVYKKNLNGSEILNFGSVNIFHVLNDKFIDLLIKNFAKNSM